MFSALNDTHKKFITCLLAIWAFLCSCNAPINVDVDSLGVKKEAYLGLISSSNEQETFLFFSDPHLLSYSNEFSSEAKLQFIESFENARLLINQLPLNFCLCGGDWLNDGDTRNVAKQKLLYADQQMKLMFPHYYKMMGNHDTNYQGIVSESDSSCGIIEQEFIDSYYFSETYSAYYCFKSLCSSFFILDSELNDSEILNDYKLGQLLWLARELLSEENNHIILGIHIFFEKSGLTPMSKKIIEICDAFNQRKELSIGGKSYDYRNSTGKIFGIFSGHNHRDSVSYVGSNNDLPVIQICNFTKNNTSNFDLVIIDYDLSRINMIRIGEGEDRMIII